MHMQAAQRYALHNGQDAADPTTAQSTRAGVFSFYIKMKTMTGSHFTVQACSGMTVLQLKEVNQVCNYACEDAMRMRM
jgi:hypothetical protein